ncbi:unnamed protein product [Closterium sp. NIES-53]
MCVAGCQDGAGGVEAHALEPKAPYPTSHAALPCPACRPALLAARCPALHIAPPSLPRAALPCVLRRLAGCAPPCPCPRAALLAVRCPALPTHTSAACRAALPCPRAPLLAARRPALPAHSPAACRATLLATRRPALPARRPGGCRAILPCPRAALLAVAPPCPARAPPCWPQRRPDLPTCTSLVPARRPARHAGRSIQFDTWLDDLQLLYLLSDSRDSVLLFNHTSGTSLSPPETTDSATRSQWLTRDAATCLAICNHLPLAERAPFGQHKIAKAMYDTVVARYSSPATVAPGRLILPYRFPELSAVATVKDLITHLRTSDTRYHAAFKAEFLDKNPPPMYITIYFIATRLRDSLCAVRDHFLALDPTDLTVDLLEKHLLAAETSIVAVAAARGTPRTPYGKRRIGKGKGGKSGGGGNRGGSGGGGGGSGGGGGGDGSSGGSGGFGGGGSGSGGSGGGGGGSGGSGGGTGGGSGSGGGGSGGCRGDRAGQTCGKFHTQHQCFSRLDVAWRAEFGDEVECPRWLELLRSGDDIFALDYDAILAAMYALIVSAEGDCYLCVPPDPSIEAAALGASETALPGTVPAEALHTFTLDSGASRCFFRDGTTLTPLPAPILVRLANPSWGPVLARSDWLTPPVFGGSVRLTLRSSPPLVLYDLCEYRCPPGCDGHYHHSWGHPSLPRLHGMHSRLLVSGLPRSLPPLPPSPAPPCLPCVEGRQRAAPHSSSFPPMTPPLQSLHIDVWGPTCVSGQGRERYFLLVVDDSTRYTTVFPFCSKGEVTDVLIPWIRAVRLQLRERFREDLPVLHLHSDRGVRAARPTITRLLATVVTCPSFESAAASALVAELVDFASACLVAETESECPPSVKGECALSTDVLEDREKDFECLAAAVPHLLIMLLAPEGDPNAPDIPTPRSYAEAITGPYSSQWQTAMDAEIASWKSTDTYVDAVPPSGVNIVDGMWIFRVKRPPGSPPVFKARYVARDFSQRQGVDFFHTFSSTPKMNTLGAPREWHDTLRTTLAALGFSPSTSDPSLFLRTDTLLPPFYILVYVDDLVFATADTEALSFVKLELQKRHTCTDLGPSALWLPVLLATVHSSVYRLALSSTFGRVQDWEAAKRVLRYFCSTSGMGLVHGGRCPVVLTGHADASWVDDLATQRLSQGYTFSLGSGSISWQSTRSSSVLSSSCEAEIYAGAMAAQELRWLTYLLTDLGERPRSSPVLYIDNKAMIALCQEHRLEHRTNHISLHYFLARELHQHGQLRLAYVATRANTADTFTKALEPSDHQRFCTVLGLVPILPHLLTA